MKASLSINSLIHSTVEKLQNYGITNAKNEIIWYLHHLKILEKHKLYLNSKSVDNKVQQAIHKFYLKRKRGIPFQHIIGCGNFYGRDFFINEYTLIPRPETEVLIDIVKGKTFKKALDIGTGSGILAITLSIEKIANEVLATDISSFAIEVAEKNKIHFQTPNVSFKLHNILTESFNEKYDLILSNPPYVTLSEYSNLAKQIKEYEPKIALTDFKDGLTFYNRFAKILRDILNPGGIFICELGSSTINSQILKIFTNQGFTTKIYKDLNSDDRALKINL